MALNDTDDTTIHVKIELETNEDKFVINECLKEEFKNEDLVSIKVEFKEEPVDYELEIDQPSEYNCSVTECPLSESIETNYEDNRADSCNTLNEINMESHTNKFPCNQSDKQLTKAKKINKHTFVCTSCNKKFTTKGHLKTHVYNHCHPKHGPYTCDVCDKRYHYKSLLIVHMRTHTGERPFTCNVCGKCFCHKSGVNEHMKIHTGEKSFHCNVCDKKFRQKYDLKLHTQIHTGEKHNACYMCDKKFRRKYDLNVHIRTHTGEKPYGCHLCKKKFTSKCNLDLHKIAHIDKCKVLSNSTLTKHKPRKKEMPITKKFVLKNDTKSHYPVDFEASVQVHTTSRFALHDIPEQSNQMTDDSKIQNNTNIYIKQELIPIQRVLIVAKTELVTSEEQYVKNECLKSEEEFVNVKQEFVDKSTVIAIESGRPVKPIEYNSVSDSLLSENLCCTKTTDTFTCDVCSRQFTSKRNLRRHIIIHSEHRSFFICKVCKRRCLHKKTLTVHMRTHTGEKPFACSMCSKKFRQKCDLTKHIRTHTGQKPFSCQICDKKFSQKYNLQMHARTHTGERPYACDKCVKMFLQKCSLTKHKKTHNKEKSYRKRVI